MPSPSTILRGIKCRTESAPRDRHAIDSELDRGVPTPSSYPAAVRTVPHSRAALTRDRIGCSPRRLARQFRPRVRP